MCDTISSPAVSCRAVPTIQEKRDKARDEIIFLTQELLMKKREFNDLAGVGRLAPELLVEVFAHYLLGLLEVAERASKQSVPTAGRNVMQDFLRVSHVSHYWREVSLDTPSLWCDIYIGPFGCAEEIKERLARTREQPLRIRVHNFGRGEDYSDTIHHLLPHFHRIQLFDCRNPTLCLVRGLGGAVPPTAPRLRSLGLLDWHTSDTPFDECAMPALQELVFGGPRMGVWKSPLLRPTLTNLAVSFTSHTSTMQDMITALRSMPLLEKLELLNALPRQLEDDALVSMQSLYADLPRLKTFILSEWAYVITLPQFFALLRLPSSTTVSIVSSDSGMDHGDLEMLSRYRAVLSALRDLLANSGGLSRPILTTHIQVWADWYHRMFTFVPHVTLSPPESLHPSGSSLKFTGSAALEGMRLVNALNAIFDTFPFNDLRILSLEHTDNDAITDREYSMWYYWLNRLPRLQELRIGPHEAVMVCNLLGFQMPRTEDEHEGPVKFWVPQLQTLVFDRVDFLPNDYTTACLCGRYWKNLRTRKQEGLPFGRLIVKNCVGFGERDRDAFRGVVREVVWDGKNAADGPQAEEPVTLAST